MSLGTTALCKGTGDDEQDALCNGMVDDEQDPTVSTSLLWSSKAVWLFTGPVKSLVAGVSRASLM